MLRLGTSAIWALTWTGLRTLRRRSRNGPARCSVSRRDTHERAEPLELPPFLVEFLRDALTHSESLLAIARKNA